MSKAIVMKSFPLVDENDIVNQQDGATVPPQDGASGQQDPKKSKITIWPFITLILVVIVVIV